MPFDASKVERLRTWECNRDQERWFVGPRHLGDKPQFVRAFDFDACAAALDEARAEVEKLKGIVREYQNSALIHWPCRNGGERCFLCKRADEGLGGK